MTRAAPTGLRRIWSVDERARIEAEITALEASADNLAAKTATWGIDRADKAMESILRKLDKLKPTETR